MNALQQTMPIINQSINACCDCREAAKTLKTHKTGNDRMLPVSESVDAFGNVEETDKVLIAIGGGYMAELPVENAVKFYEGRIAERKVELQKIKAALGQQQLTKDQIEIEIRSRGIQ